MFPEFLDQCLEFKDFIKAHGWKILVADGESGRAIEFYKPFIEGRAIDVCQADMRQFGIDGIMTIAALCRKNDILMAPHNWGSLMGFYMQLHIGRAISNFYRAEHDPVKKGYATVPAAPGFGLKVIENKFTSEVKIRFDIKQ